MREVYVLCEIDTVDCELVGAILQYDIVVLCEVVVYSAKSEPSAASSVLKPADLPINLLIDHQIPTFPLSLGPRSTDFIKVRQPTLESLDLDLACVVDTEIRMEEGLELEVVGCRCVMYALRSLLFSSRDRFRKGGNDGISRGGDSARNALLRVGVDNVQICGQFVFGEGDDVGEVEWVREEGGDFWVWVETESDGDARVSVHDDVVECLRWYGVSSGPRSEAEIGVPSCGFERSRVGSAWHGTSVIRRLPWAAGRRWAIRSVSLY